MIVRLNEDANNDNVAKVNLQDSESAIRDLNSSVLAQSNANADSVLALFR